MFNVASVHQLLFDTSPASPAASIWFCIDVRKCPNAAFQSLRTYDWDPGSEVAHCVYRSCVQRRDRGSRAHSCRLDRQRRRRWNKLWVSSHRMIPMLNYFAVESHLQTQRAAIKMLHERILVLMQYVTEVIVGKDTSFSHVLWNWLVWLGQAKKDHAMLRSLSALIASLPASENKAFREEFETVGWSLFRRHFHAHTIP